MRVNQLFSIKYWDWNYSIKSNEILKAGGARSATSTTLMKGLKQLGYVIKLICTHTKSSERQQQDGEPK